MNKFTTFLRKIFSKIFGKKSDEELGASSRSEYSAYDNSRDDPRRVRPYKSSHLAQELNRSASISHRYAQQRLADDKEDEDEDEEEKESSYGRNPKHYSGLNEHLNYVIEEKRIPVHSNRVPEEFYSKRNPRQYSGINDHKKELEAREKAVIHGSDPAALREKARKEVEKAHQPSKSHYKPLREQMMENFRNFGDDEK